MGNIGNFSCIAPYSLFSRITFMQRYLRYLLHIVVFRALQINCIFGWRTITHFEKVLNSHLIPRCLKTNQNVSFFRLIRPVGNSTDRLTVKMGLKLSQIIGVDMKRQILITNVWLEQEWLDYKLKWNPADYGNVRHLHVPSQHIWLPDIVLYNKWVKSLLVFHTVWLITLRQKPTFYP